MKHIPTPMSCVKGYGMNLCRGLRGYGRDLREKIYTDIGLTKKYIKDIKNVYLVLKTYYCNLLHKHMVEETEIPDLWKIFKRSVSALPNYRY